MERIAKDNLSNPRFAGMVGRSDPSLQSATEQENHTDARNRAHLPPDEQDTLDSQIDTAAEQ